MGSLLMPSLLGYKARLRAFVPLRMLIVQVNLFCGVLEYLATVTVAKLVANIKTHL